MQSFEAYTTVCVSKFLVVRFQGKALKAWFLILRANKAMSRQGNVTTVNRTLSKCYQVCTDECTIKLLMLSV